MIFQREHIKQIKNGIKTQTRRVNRGKYEAYWGEEGQIYRDYAVQPCRTCKGIKGMRIVIDDIWCEAKPNNVKYGRLHVYGQGYSTVMSTIPISKEDAKAEGNYTPEEFEKKFRELNPKWNGLSRWVFVFHLGERIGGD